MNDSTISIVNLKKTFASGIVALKGINLEISAGMFGLLGANGAGKSTLMKILATLLEADSGTARMNQIVGIVDWYVFPSISVGVTAERLMSQFFWGRPADEANIAKAMPHARTCVRELERLKGASEFMTGDRVSIADLMLAPHLEYFRATPEGAELMKGTPLDGWLTRMGMRASMQATQAERLKQIA